MARLRAANPSVLEGSSALTWAVVFLVVDLFLGLSVGALSFTQARARTILAGTDRRGW